VSIQSSTSSAPAVGEPRSAEITISRWVNQPLPDFRGILCSHDVARLIRRPRWLLCSLALIGRFPRKQRYRGRPIGWQRSEVLEWLTRGLEAANDADFTLPAQRQGVPSKRHPHQACLPLECGERCLLPPACHQRLGRRACESPLFARQNRGSRHRPCSDK
jgi:hypothetical protein